MTIAQSLKKYSDIESDLFLAHILKKSREFLYMHGQQKLTEKQALSFKSMAVKRKKGMPAAYLLGYKYFYGLKFKVSRSVLIPRPETEWLVDEAIRIATKKLKRSPSKELRILDVGTGSGCIAISIAKNLSSKKVKVYATDISEPALKVAKSNAKTNKVKINFSKHDLLKGVSGKFDIIIANLPYVPIKDYKKLYQNLKYEPKQALTDATNDFTKFKKFINQLGGKLAPQGIALLETDPKSFSGLRKQIKTALPEKKLRTFKDIHKLDRFIKIY